ncbi:hypothetical protein [Nocardioides sp. T2.26MG-1]|uniref:hypothetical protein n=1 Tax=Nocardioides sp. T2.26MG-1 TaxID=3041166 RepID=UPI0024774846|nr:hypothetical protein [Nocardioides sp. T2.26MG-1]CAI9409713.1 hypothetical protein HIDPHFAB_01343 [Nocardioides sp. T2.26MG-1]
MEIVTGEPAPMVPPAQAAALMGEMAAVVRTIFAVHAPAQTAADPSATAPSLVATAPAPSPAPLAAIPLPELDELAFLD